MIKKFGFTLIKLIAHLTNNQEVIANCALAEILRKNEWTRRWLAERRILIKESVGLGKCTYHTPGDCLNYESCLGGCIDDAEKMSELGKRAQDHFKRNVQVLKDK